MHLCLELMNAPRGSGRARRLRRRRRGAQLHPRGGADGHVAIGAEPDGQAAGSAAWGAAADPHDAQRRGHRGRGAVAGVPEVRLRRNRDPTGRARRVTRPARRHDPDHRRPARRRHGAVPGDRATAAGLSRRERRAFGRHRISRHRRRPLRRRSASGRTGREGHDRGAHRPGPTHGAGRRARLLRPETRAAHAARPDRPQLHQPAVPDPGRALRLGVREGRAGAERAGRGPAGLQRDPADRPGGLRGPGAGLRP